jgi:hypothetical protein
MYRTKLNSLINDLKEIKEGNQLGLVIKSLGSEIVELMELLLPKE